MITIPGNNTCYEIGVVRRRDGLPGYILLYDFYAGGHGMTAMVGTERCSKLKKAYSTQVTMKILAKMGCQISSADIVNKKKLVIKGILQ